MNLRTKINMASACLVLVVVVGMMSSLYVSDRKQLWQAVREEQKEELAKLARVYKEVLFEENEVILLNYVKTLVLEPKVAFAGFAQEGGAGWIYAGPNLPFVFPNPSDPSVQEIFDSGRLLVREGQGLAGESVTEMSRPTPNKAYIRLAYSNDVINKEVSAQLSASLKKLTVLGVIAILFGLLLSHFLSSALSLPIFNLMNASRRLASGQKRVTIPEAGLDELGQLTRTFNHMSKELAKLDELKDEFMSHVTHELRSPLTSIIATVELMEEMALVNANPKMKRSVDRLKYGSERLNRLVDNILDLTRMEAGKMQFDIQPINLATIACEMVDFFEPRAMEKNLYIRADVPRTIPLANGDSEKIRQVLSNLIHNAIKFTNDGGITVWVRHRDGTIRVGVQDTGVGIPRAKLKTVFSKFETLKDTRDRVRKPVPGSGLGLNIVMNSLKAQKGLIWAESEVDQGTTFIFTLPVAEGSHKDATQRPASNTHSVPLHVEGNGKRHPVLVGRSAHQEKVG